MLLLGLRVFDVNEALSFSFLLNHKHYLTVLLFVSSLTYLLGLFTIARQQLSCTHTWWH